jgi:chromatin assembly factor 1 subunit A
MLLSRSVNNALQAKQDLLSIFESLTQEERDAILDPKGTAKVPPKENLSEASKSVDVAVDTSKGSPEGPKKLQKKKGEDEENDSVRLKFACSLSIH